METPPKRKFEKWMRELGKEEKIDLTKFKRLLIIVETDGKYVGTWTPIEFASMGNIENFLHVVKQSDLKGIKYTSSASKYVLTAHLPITPTQLTEILSLTKPKDNFYQEMYNRLLAYDAIEMLTEEILVKSMMEVGIRLLEMRRKYHRVSRSLPPHRMKEENKWKKRVEESDEESEGPQSAFRVVEKEKPTFDYSTYVAKFNLEELNDKLNEGFEKEFRKLRYEIWSPLLDQSPEKIRAFLEILNLCIRFFKNNSVRLIGNQNYEYMDHGEISQSNISVVDLINAGFNSPDVCGIFKYLSILNNIDMTGKAQKIHKRMLRIKGGQSLLTYLNTKRRDRLELLRREETRIILDPKSEVMGDEIFILPLDALKYIWKEQDIYFEKLREFTFGMLDLLDLSDSYVTGSVIPACLHKPEDPDYQKFFYPAFYTVPKDYDSYRRIIKADNYTLIKKEKTYLLKDKETGEECLLTIEDGADIDIAIQADDEKDFDEIAERHYRALKKKYPEAHRRKVERKKTYMWEITGIPRIIQIYRSDLKRICTHHVAMVRGFITGNGEDRMFYLTASCFYSLQHEKSPNYYYFAGKRYPVETILKYNQRGFEVQVGSIIGKYIKGYREKASKWNLKDFKLTAVRGRVNYKMEDDLNYIQKNFPALIGYGNFNVEHIEQQRKEFRQRFGFEFREFSIDRLLEKHRADEEVLRLKREAMRDSKPKKIKAESESEEEKKPPRIERSKMEEEKSDSEEEKPIRILPPKAIEDEEESEEESEEEGEDEEEEKSEDEEDLPTGLKKLAEIREQRKRE